MSFRWPLLALVALLLLGAVPAHAEVLEIDPTEPPPATLSEDETAKLAALQNATFAGLASEISPDDTSVLAAFFSNEGFNTVLLDIRAGSQQSLDAVLEELPPFSEVRWANGETLVYISVRYDEPNDTFVPVIASINRTSGEVGTRDLELPGFPISLSRGGGLLLVEVAPPDEDEAERMRSPFKRMVRTQLPRTGPKSPWRAPNGRLSDELRAFADESVRLAVLDLRTGELTDVLALPESSGLTSLAWGQNDDRLAIGYTNLIEAGNLQLTSFVLSNVTTQDARGNLAPANNPFYQGSTVTTFDLTDGVSPLATLRAPELGADLFYDVSWATDGQTLMAHMLRPAQIAGRKYPTYLFSTDSYLRFFSADGRPVGSLARPELANGSVVIPRFVSPDELIIQAPRGLDYGFYYHNWRSGEFRALPSQEGRVSFGQFATSRLSRQIVYSHASLTSPPELYRITWEGQAIHGLSFNNAELKALNQVQVHRVDFTLASGAKRQGLLVQPAGAAFPPRNSPIAVWQEGGPGGIMGNAWGGNVENPYNLLPNFGVSVLIVPLPGRQNYGPAFAEALADRNNFGQIDIDEQAEIVRQMIARGWTSSSKIGIVGCSYGGYFTTQSIARHPGLYAAANTQCSWVEMIHDFQFIGAPLNAYLQGSSPQTNSAEYVADSPLYNASKIRTPTLIFHGTEDFQPLGFMETMHDQLEENGVPVELMIFLGEGHGLSAASSQLAAGEAQVRWFRQYLGVR